MEGARTDKEATMKKLLMTLTIAGTLAVPAGVALAQDGTPEPVDTTTVVEPMREQARLHGQDRDQQCDGVADMMREQVRTRAHVATADTAQAGSLGQYGPGECSGDCSGDQLRDRDQLHDQDGLGDGARYGNGGFGRNA